MNRAALVAVLAALTLAAGVGGLVHEAQAGDDAAKERARAGVERPVRVLVIGDSVMAQTEGYVTRGLSDRGGFTLRTNVQYGASLIQKPDWLAIMEHEIDTYDPDVIVASFGGNYIAPFYRRPDGSEIVAGSDEHFQMWERATNQAMRRLTERGAVVYWVLGPHVKPRFLDDIRVRIDDIYWRLRTQWPQARYVDGYTPLATPKATYVDFVRDARGRKVPMRDKDGVHFSAEGAIRFANAIVTRLDADHAVRLGRR